jgi:hypothetical protein
MKLWGVRGYPFPYRPDGDQFTVAAAAIAATINEYYFQTI